MKTLDLGRCFSVGWKAFADNAALALAGGVIYLFVQVVMWAIGQAASIGLAFTQSQVLMLGGQLVISILSMAVNTFLVLGLAKMAVDAVTKRPVDFSDLFGQAGKFARGLICNILVTVASILFMAPGVALGVFLVIQTEQPLFMLVALLGMLPGLIPFVLTIFSSFLIVDADLDAIGAIKGSMRMTQGNRLLVLVLLFACFGIMLVGTLMCVGIVIALPLTFLTVAVAYVDLKPQGDHEDDDIQDGIYDPEPV